MMIALWLVCFAGNVGLVLGRETDWINDRRSQVGGLNVGVSAWSNSGPVVTRTGCQPAVAVVAAFPSPFTTKYSMVAFDTRSVVPANATITKMQIKKELRLVLGAGQTADNVSEVTRVGLNDAQPATPDELPVLFAPRKWEVGMIDDTTTKDVGWVWVSITASGMALSGTMLFIDCVQLKVFYELAGTPTPPPPTSSTTTMTTTASTSTSSSHSSSQMVTTGSLDRQLSTSARSTGSDSQLSASTVQPLTDSTLPIVLISVGAVVALLLVVGAIVFVVRRARKSEQGEVAMAKPVPARLNANANENYGSPFGGLS
jgi:hypothetical protein